MNSRYLMFLTALASFAALAIPARLAAQRDNDNYKHHRWGPNRRLR